MFVYVIQSNCKMYFIFGIFHYISSSMCYSSTLLLLHYHFYQYFFECYIYVYWNIIVYFIRSDIWLYPNLGILSCMFPVYYLLFHFHHSSLTVFTKLDQPLLFELVVAFIKTHIFVPSLSIYHLFISIIFFLLFLTLRAALHFKYSTL